ncbi:hypothetical protein [Candidatus Leptofilum sp.]|uniref:hypothetical protein n=1 Tax=Candidatus Leptofilum sp. TaxID=3241576 RepID=UPI003B58B62C
MSAKPEESGAKWWLRYILVPLFGGGGVIAIVVALINNPLAIRQQSPTPITLNGSFFEEKFLRPELQSWLSFENGGEINHLNFGGIQLKQLFGSEFPFLLSGSNPFPESGEFELSVQFRYDKVTHYGSGISIAICCQTNATPSHANTLVSIWQDSSDGIRVETWDYENLSRSYYFLGQGITSTEEHIFKLQYLDDDTALISVDNQDLALFTASRRPNQIWIGNPFQYDPPQEWSAISVRSIHVTSK